MTKYDLLFLNASNEMMGQCADTNSISSLLLYIVGVGTDSLVKYYPVLSRFVEHKCGYLLCCTKTNEIKKGLQKCNPCSEWFERNLTQLSFNMFNNRIHSNSYFFTVSTILIFEITFIHTTITNNDSVRNTNKFHILKHDTWTLFTVIK